MLKKCIAVALLCTLLFTSCSISPTTNDNQQSESTSPPQSIATTSVSIMQICQAMGIDLVGVPDSDLTEIPEIYSDATVIGHPMSPDLEILAQVNPDIVLSPVTLISDLQPKYEAANLEYAFLNLKSVYGMFKSIEDLGVMLNKEAEAQVLIDEFYAYYDSYKDKSEGKEAPRVLVLMGLPGSYVVATENSYAGSLVDLAGAINVYSGTDQEFLNVNTEDMLQKDPDIILRTAHALPDEVVEMFKEEFETNDIWSNFDAVEEGEVYDLPYEYFGMSANFEYAKGLEVLEEVLYGEGN